MLVVRERTVPGRVIEVVERQAATTCAYCHDPLAAAPRACACGATYHLDCWLELGRCGTLGCKERPLALDVRRSGRCPRCLASVARALPWERAECECGAAYHLACRMLLSRCEALGCGHGDHDGWGHPRAPSPGLLGAFALALLDALAPRTALQVVATSAGLTLLLAALTVLERGASAAALVGCGLSLVASLAASPGVGEVASSRLDGYDPGP